MAKACTAMPRKPAATYELDSNTRRKPYSPQMCPYIPVERWWLLSYRLLGEMISTLDKRKERQMEEPFSCYPITKNMVLLEGMIVSDIIYDHDYFGIHFYELMVNIERRTD